ncbi:hypothetical protein ACHAXN_007338 [Cyclotella atomus]
MTEHPEYEMEELVALLRKEDNHHYWSSSEAETGGLAQAWRHKICDWFYELVDHYNFDREVVGIALHYFDRYIAKRSDGFLVREKYQLAAMSALFLAIKIHGVSEDGSSAKIKALSRLCYGHFEGEQVLAAEKDILVALEWFIHPPSMHQVAMAFSQVHPLRYVSPSNNSYVYEAARFQCELAVFLPDLLQKYKPSEIVFAAMLNATEKVDPIVLTSQMKNQFMSLLHLPELGLDESKVAEVKAYMKRSFPVPDLSMNLSPDLVEEPQERLSSVSPTNVSEF